MIEVDLIAAGDGLVTRDTATGFDWLDLKISKGLTHSELGIFTDDGWRIANEREICGLFGPLGDPFGNSGFCNPSPAQGMFSRQTLGTNEDESQLAIVLLLGSTGGFDTARYRRSQGFFKWENPAPNTWWYSRASVQYKVPDTGCGFVFFCGHAYEIGGTSIFNPSDISTGWWLVRPIPEPSTALLLASGLVVLAIRQTRLTNPRK